MSAQGLTGTMAFRAERTRGFEKPGALRRQGIQCVSLRPVQVLDHLIIKYDALGCAQTAQLFGDAGVHVQI